MTDPTVTVCVDWPGGAERVEAHGDAVGAVIGDPPMADELEPIPRPRSPRDREGHRHKNTHPPFHRAPSAGPPERIKDWARSGRRHERESTVQAMAETSRKVALVTGASRGIGKAAAIMLAEAGYDVAVSARTVHEGEGRSDTEGVALPGSLDTTVGRSTPPGPKGSRCGWTCSTANVLDGVDAVMGQFGRIDVLVNNAIYQGYGTMVEFADLSEEDLHRIFEGNVYAQLALIRACCRRWSSATRAPSST